MRQHMTDTELEIMWRAWERQTGFSDHYEPGTEPWDDPSTRDDEATNAVGNGWACRIGHVILTELADGSLHSYVYATERDARDDWPNFEDHYGDRSGESLNWY